MKKQPNWTLIITVATVLSLLGFAAFLTAFLSVGAGDFLRAALVFASLSYLLLVRFAVGRIIDIIFHNRMNYQRAWFQPKPFERKLYRALKVRAWATKIPTYDPSLFSLSVHTPEEVIMATCQAEVCHELNAVLSFAVVFVGAFTGRIIDYSAYAAVFALFDLSFVAVLRYHRRMFFNLLSKRNNSGYSAAKG